MSAERILFLKFVGILKFGKKLSILRTSKIRKIRILNLCRHLATACFNNAVHVSVAYSLYQPTVYQSLWSYSP